MPLVLIVLAVLALVAACAWWANVAAYTAAEHPFIG
jgi:hypothetical protein